MRRTEAVLDRCPATPRSWPATCGSSRWSSSCHPRRATRTRTPEVASGPAAGPAKSRTKALPYERSVLPNGLRVVTQAMPAARSVSVGIVVGVGSRHEKEAKAGLSHLLEHLVFKGTRGHPDPGDLSEAVEACGGSVNAATARELTVYSARVPAEAAGRALEVVPDVVLHPLLRQRDLVAEKPVIVDEIRMYMDSPGDHVFSLFDELLFGRHPLGREIAGTPRSVRRATRESVHAHWSSWYRPPHLVLAVAGAIEHQTVLDAAVSRREDEDHRGDDVGDAVATARRPALLAPRASPASAAACGDRSLAQG